MVAQRSCYYIGDCYYVRAVPATLRTPAFWLVVHDDEGELGRVPTELEARLIVEAHAAKADRKVS